MLTSNLINSYEQLLAYSFEIELEDSKIITLLFDKKNLKHLIGFHNIDTFSKRKGSQIYSGIKNRKITIDGDQIIYKTTNDKLVKINNINSIDKITKFPEMKSYLFSQNQEKDKIIEFDKSIVSYTCLQGSEYLLHLESGNERYHLGISFDLDLNYYFPKSFLIEKGTRKDRYIKDQKKIAISKITRKKRQ